MKSISYSLDDIAKIIAYVASLTRSYKVITFTGALGAGKTTLIGGVLRHLGVEGPITSPTFNYVNVYHLKNDTVVYHFDLYRLQGLEDFLRAGFDELLYAPQSLSLVEWPQIIMPLLGHSVCHSTIEHGSQNNRIFSCECIQ